MKAVAAANVKFKNENRQNYLIQFQLFDSAFTAQRTHIKAMRHGRVGQPGPKYVLIGTIKFKKTG